MEHIFHWLSVVGWNWEGCQTNKDRHVLLLSGIGWKQVQECGGYGTTLETGRC